MDAGEGGDEEVKRALSMSLLNLYLKEFILRKF